MDFVDGLMKLLQFKRDMGQICTKSITKEDFLFNLQVCCEYEGFAKGHIYIRDIRVFLPSSGLSSLSNGSMPNSLVNTFGTSEFDETGEICSIWANCNYVSYEKFVVKCQPWKHWDSLLQKLWPIKCLFSLLNSIFVQVNKESQIVKMLSRVDTRIEISQSWFLLKK